MSDDTTQSAPEADALRELTDDELDEVAGGTQMKPPLEP